MKKEKLQLIIAYVLLFGGAFIIAGVNTIT